MKVQFLAERREMAHEKDSEVGYIEHKISSMPNQDALKACRGMELRHCKFLALALFFF